MRDGNRDSSLDSSLPCSFNVLICRASWLILFPDLPSSEPSVSSIWRMVLESTNILDEWDKILFLTISDRFMPSVFSRARNCAFSFSVKRSSNRQTLLFFCVSVLKGLFFPIKWLFKKELSQ